MDIEQGINVLNRIKTLHIVYFSAFLPIFALLMKRICLLILICFVFQPWSLAKDEIVSFKLSKKDGLPHNVIRQISQGSDGSMYFLGLYGLYKYDGYSFITLSDSVFYKTRNEFEKSPRITNEIHDNRGNRIKIDEQTGYVTYIDRNKNEELSFKVFDKNLLTLSNNLKVTVLTDHRGLVWISINGNGVFVYNKTSKQLRHINKKSGLIDSDYIIFMMEDDEGNIWLSLENYGITCLKVIQADYRIIDISKDSQHERKRAVRMLCRLEDKRILVADNYGTLQISDNELQTMKVFRQDGENYISACLDKYNNLWLGSRTKGVVINNRHFGNDRIDCIIKDHQDRMWICGLSRHLTMASFIGDNYSERHFMVGIPQLSPRVMIQDRMNNIWIGTKQGLFYFNPDTLLACPDAYTQICKFPIMCIHEDKSGHIWAGTEGKGVIIITNKESKTIKDTLTTINGLTNNAIRFITENSKNEICIGTEDGCTFYRPTDQTTYPFYFSDNQIRNNCSENCRISLSNGNLAFGTMDGIVILNEDYTTKVERKFRLSITDLYINGQSVYQMQDKDYHPLTKEIHLNYTQNSLTFFFSNFNYGEYTTNYSYLLQGYDETWSGLSPQNFASYKNLPPDDYILRIKYRKGNGKLTEEEIKFNIHIHPPLWNTIEAWCLYTFLFVLIIIITCRQISHTARLRQAVIVEKQMTEYKLKFFTNISHEFRTPLTLIQGAMEKMEEIKDMPSTMKHSVQNMRRSVGRLQRLINQLLEFRRMQNNRLSLSLQETEMVTFVRNIYNSFHDIAEHQEITCRFLPSDKTIICFIDRGYIDKIIYNLLSNAFKYTPKGGNITLKLKKQDGQINIIVEDTGIGVPQEKQAQLFERYASGKLKADSIGIGLNLTYELVCAHHGNITYSNNSSQGSIFTVCIPIDKGIYRSEDYLLVHPVLTSNDAIVESGFETSHTETLPIPINNRQIAIVCLENELNKMLRYELGRIFSIAIVDNNEKMSELKNTCHKFDLILCDNTLADSNVFTFIREIRNDSSMPHIPIVLLTSPDKNIQERALRTGVDVCITQPFSPKLLLLQCIRLLEQRDRLETIFKEQLSEPSSPTLPILLKEETDKKFIEKFDVYITNHIDNPNLSIDQIAEHFGYSRAMFFRKVRTLTGSTPNEFIKEKRMLYATDLLSQENLTITEVSYRVGISNPQYFATCFKKRFGVSPKDYKKGQ